MGVVQRARSGAVAAFALIVLATALGNLSQTAMNAMLPVIASEYGVDVAVAQWLSSAYMLVLGVAVPLSAFVALKLGIRKALLLMLAFFCAGSLIDFFAPSFAALLLGRILQAVAAGMCMPLSQTAAMVFFPPNRRATAMGVSGIALGFAPNIGPTIGGVLVDAFGWRSFFLLLAAAIAVLAVCTLAFVDGKLALPGSGDTARFDTVSFTLSGVGFTGLLMSFTNASSYGAASTACLVPLAVGIVFVALFFWRQGRSENPLVSLRVFASRRYTVGLVCSMLLFASFMGITLIIPLFIEDLRGGTALEAGMVLLPGTIAALVFNPLSGILADKLGARRVVLIGGVLLVVGAVAAVLFTKDTPLGVIMLLQGVRASGVSLLIAAVISWSLSDLDPRILPGGSSFSVMARQATASFGTALMVLCVTAASAGGLVPAFGFTLAFGLSAVFAVVMLVVAVVYVK